jgi:hypothetical protein
MLNDFRKGSSQVMHQGAVYTGTNSSTTRANRDLGSPKTGSETHENECLEGQLTGTDGVPSEHAQMSDHGQPARQIWCSNPGERGIDESDSIAG